MYIFRGCLQAWLFVNFQCQAKVFDWFLAKLTIVPWKNHCRNNRLSFIIFCFTFLVTGRQCWASRWSSVWHSQGKIDFNLIRVLTRIIISDNVEKILKGNPDSIPLPLTSVKIQIMGRKFCSRCKGKTLLPAMCYLITSSKCSCQQLILNYVYLQY